MLHAGSYQCGRERTLQPLRTAISAMLSPSSAQRLEPPPSTTSTRPCPGSSSACPTRRRRTEGELCYPKHHICIFSRSNEHIRGSGHCAPIKVLLLVKRNSARSSCTQSHCWPKTLYEAREHASC